MFVLIVSLICALTIWFHIRWKVWFHNPKEEPYVSLSIPHRVLLTFGDEKEMSRNVSWQADSILLPSYLELVQLPDSDTLRVEAQGEVFRSNNGQAAYYVARLRQLQPKSHYAYRAVTNGKTSPWYEFQTHQENGKELSFLYIGDVQDTIGGQTNQILRNALLHHPESEFIVSGGDIIERPIEKYWVEAFQDIDSVCQTLPILSVTGNHEYRKGIIMKLEHRFSLVFSYFQDSALNDNQVYSLCYGPAQFFLLDSNRELPYLLTQRKWLEKQLSQSKAKWKIVVLHHPLYSIKGYKNLIQRWVFNGLIKDYGVDLVLQGHEHAYARMSNHDEEGTATTPIYTVSHCSPKHYHITFDEQFDKFGISSRYYQTIGISNDTLTLSAYEVYGNTLYDSLQIVKSTEKPFINDLGSQIPEYLEFTPRPGKKKDIDYAQRIKKYKEEHPERIN